MALLRKIQSIKEFENLRLVGGTALALHIGHRHSIDLDLFGKFNLSHNEVKQTIEKEKINLVLNYETNSIYSCICDGIKVDIVNYPIAWFSSPIIEGGIQLASLEDIVAMKLKAVADRGSKKDFIDIYFLLNYFSMEEMLQLFNKKFPEIALFMVVKSLTYFIDAEEQVMPKMFIPTSWEAVKEKLCEEIRKV